MADHERSRNSRRSTYHMIIIVALAIAAGRIAVVTSKEGDTPFLSANDRSRWCTVASLVERGTYEIDAQINDVFYAENDRRRPWNTIDKVRHLGRDGKQHDYSSKPPLFPTMVAGVYKLVNMFSGMTLSGQPTFVARIVLALVNLPLLALFFYATIYSIERLCRSDWARRIAAVSTCFATMLLPFATSLNNHLPAAAATAAAMWIYLYTAERLDAPHDDPKRHVAFGIWFAAGASAAFAAANELPALSMMVFWFILFAMLSRESVAGFATGVAIVAIGFFGTNWLAHHSLRPPYMHRGNGDLIANLQAVAAKPDSGLETEIREILHDHGLLDEGTPLKITASKEDQRWVVDGGQNGPRYALLQVGSGWQLAHWDDWYEYEGSYWSEENLKGVDQGEPSRLIYFLHITFGHHGLFLLTPIWLLVPLGLLRGPDFGPSDYRRLALAVLVATVVCLAFYLSRPLIDRNYGGVSVCFRWMLWFAPLWLLIIAPVLEGFTAAKQRIVVLVLLALSVFSMSTALGSPWQSPWPYQFWAFWTGSA